jgi:hypothetical protein
MLDTIKIAVDKGAKIFASISGGKDGQAMTKVLASQFKITGLVHAELGRIEWAACISWPGRVNRFGAHQRPGIVLPI